MKNEAIPKWNEIVLLHLGKRIPSLSAHSQKNGLRCGSPVQLAFFEEYRYFRSKSIIENAFPDGFLNHINTTEELTLRKSDSVLQFKDVWKAICSAQTCTMYNQAPRCGSLFEITISPQGGLLSPSQGTLTSVKPQAVPQRIAMA